MALVADETILRLFPPLPMAWALAGEQAVVPISGHNARRVLYAAVNVRTGHRVLHRGKTMRQGEFHAFLQAIRRAYRGRRVWLLLDRHGSHGPAASRKLADSLDVELLALPRQCPELNPVDHLWKKARKTISANRPFASIDDHAEAVEDWITGLTRRQTLRKAGILSKNFWLLT